MKPIFLFACLSVLAMGCYEEMEGGTWCHPLYSSPGPECYRIDSDGDGVVDAEDSCPFDKVHECGVGCFECKGATEYCTAEGQCVDDCAGIVCGQSPSGGFDCGMCNGTTETCLLGHCEDLGYVWQNPPAANTKTWQDAIDYCGSLTLGDHNDWRLPTISELRSLIRGCPATETGGSCGVTDSCLSYSACRNDPCSGCSSGAGPAGGCYWPDGMEGTCSWYWSSSEREDGNNAAWGLVSKQMARGNYIFPGGKIFRALWKRLGLGESRFRPKTYQATILRHEQCGRAETDDC